jgi:hypothetical protein
LPCSRLHHTFPFDFPPPLGTYTKRVSQWFTRSHDLTTPGRHLLHCVWPSALEKRTRQSFSPLKTKETAYWMFFSQNPNLPDLPQNFRTSSVGGRGRREKKWNALHALFRNNKCNSKQKECHIVTPSLSDHFQ